MTTSQEFASLSFGTRLAVWWGFVWRGLIITVGSMIGGGIAGGIVGFIAALLGVPPDDKNLIMALGGIAGGIVGLFFMWVYVHWLFRAHIAGYRLQLMKL